MFIILVIVALVVPWEYTPASPPVAKADMFQSMQDESMVGLQLAMDKDNSTTKPQAVQCKCGGKGFILSGDGIEKLPCPAGDNCVAKTNKPAPNPPAGEKQEKKIVANKQVIAFYKIPCPGCIEFDKKYGKQLKDEGYGFDESPDSLIRHLDYAKFPNEWAKYGWTGYLSNVVPKFVLIENGKTVKYLTGTVTAEQVKALLK